MRRALVLCLVATVPGGCRGGAPPSSGTVPDAAPRRVDWASVVEAMPSTGNLISNGGFEDAELPPWYVPTSAGWHPGVISGLSGRSGRQGLRAQVEAAAGTSGAARWGAMYQVGAVPFPRHVSLWYRVDRWRSANATQYVFFAVLVGAGGTTYQMRYFLSGVDAMPYRDNGNVRFVLVERGAPPLGKWVHFEADLHRDFLQRWGRVPSSFERLSFAVEARFEARAKLEGAIEADVSFDDVFVGWTAAPR